MPKLPLFPTSVVGSLPRPALVLDLINDRPPLPPERYAPEMEAAIRFAVAMQEHAGIDVITDGEWGRKSYIGVIAELAHGFKLGKLPDGRPFTLVTDRLAPKTPGFIAREVTLLKTLTKTRIKSTLPSPALLGETNVERSEIREGVPEARRFRGRLRADSAARTRTRARCRC
ncbi:MAG: hypothetical protein ACREH8_02665 [Opitutaceae bacterium]